MNDLVVGEGTRVTLHFALELQDGTVVDSNFEGKPATFDVGDGSLLNGFEEALFGLAAGDRQQFTILPEKGFGQHNNQNVQRFKRTDFSDDTELQEGLVISFADAAQTELPGVIVNLDEETVTVDFNHPLAGRAIIFSVEILAVEPATTH